MSSVASMVSMVTVSTAIDTVREAESEVVRVRTPSIRN